jgi:uncharacterized protein (TIGR03437 family)
MKPVRQDRQKVAATDDWSNMLAYAGCYRGQPREAGLPGSQLSTIPNSAVQVMIGNQTLQPLFAGLPPQYPGVYQVQVIVPQGVQTGSAVPVTLNIVRQTSAPLTIAIQ